MQVVMFPVDRLFTDDLPSKCLTMLASYTNRWHRVGIQITNGYPMVSKASRHVKNSLSPYKTKETHIMDIHKVTPLHGYLFKQTGTK